MIIKGKNRKLISGKKSAKDIDDILLDLQGDVDTIKYKLKMEREKVNKREEGKQKIICYTKASELTGLKEEASRIQNELKLKNIG